MSVRRIWISGQKIDGRPVAEFEGLPGEEGESELYYPYGIVSGRKGGGLLVEVQDDPDNHLALAPAGDKDAFDATMIYWGDDTTIELTDDRIELTLGDAYFRMDADGISTNLTIRTTGDVIAGGISLKKHRHGGVERGGKVTNKAQQ